MLRDIIEKGEEAVVILLRDRIVFVIVAARAPHGEAEKCFASRLDAVIHIFDAVLFIDRAPFGGDVMISIEPAGDLLIQRCTRQKIAGQLIGQELVIREVRIESADHPVAPSPHRAIRVVVVSVGVGVARRVEPLKRKPLTIMRAGEQTIHEFPIGLRRRIGNQRVNVRGRRGRPSGRAKAGERVSRDPPPETDAGPAIRA